jgi:hypothetical protein
MADDALAALGLELRAEAAAWLAELTPGALPDGTQAARELFQALAQLESEVADAAADEVELTRLQAWLTAGFFAALEPFAPADVVVAEVMDEARRREGEPSGATAARPGAGASSASTEVRGASATGANEFAAGKAQSPPARTAADGPLPRTGAVADPPAPADARRVDDGRDGWPGASADPRQAPTADRRSVDGSSAPPPAGGIQGLAALAALAGSGGVQIPADADHPPHIADQPRGGSDRGAVEPAIGAYPRRAHPVDADRAEPAPVRRTADDTRPSSSADQSLDASRAREVDGDDTVHLPPRIIRIPFTPQAVERAEDADERWSASAPLPIPFVTRPGEVEQDAAPGGSAAGPTPDARQPIAIPTMRVFDGGAGVDAMPAPDARRAAEAEWAGFEAPAESTESFLARAARVAGQRLRPAAEIVSGDGAPAARTALPAPTDSAARAIIPAPPAEPDAYPTVLAREVVPAPRPVESVEWPAPDVTDLLDALASEIAHEYRRYYGE